MLFSIFMNVSSKSFCGTRRQLMWRVCDAKMSCLGKKSLDITIYRCTCSLWLRYTAGRAKGHLLSPLIWVWSH